VFVRLSSTYYFSAISFSFVDFSLLLKFKFHFLSYHIPESGLSLTYIFKACTYLPSTSSCKLYFLSSIQACMIETYFWVAGSSVHLSIFVQ